MKKTLILLLAIAMLLALAACGAAGQEDGAAEPQAEVKDGVELLSNIWANYAEEEKFPIIGGDMEHGSSEGPDVYAVDDAAALDSTFGLPQDMADKVDGAASLVHMMNANSFTGAAFHVKDSNDVEAVTDGLRDNVLNRQWLCGFPEKLVIINVGDYVISVFGNGELVDNFKDKAVGAYAGAVIAYDELIV